MRRHRTFGAGAPPACSNLTITLTVRIYRSGEGSGDSETKCTVSISIDKPTRASYHSGSPFKPGLFLGCKPPQSNLFAQRASSSPLALHGELEGEYSCT